MKQIIFLFLVIVFLTSNVQSSFGPSDSEIRIYKGEKQTIAKYTYTIIPSNNNTWCYDIFKDKKMLIHQPSKPGLPGNDGFKNKSDAEKVARLVIEKLKKGEMPPSVTIEELKNLKVL